MADTRLLTLASFLIATAGIAQAQLSTDHGVWMPSDLNNSLVSIARSGKVAKTIDLTAHQIRPLSVSHAPNGNLWIVDGIAGGLAFVHPLAPGVVLSVPVPSPVHAVAFDAAGTVWATLPVANAVAQFSASGTLLRTVAAGPRPWGLVVDSQGLVWVALYDMTAPGLGRIDPATGMFTRFPLPASVTRAPTLVAADTGGPGVPGHLWMAGGGQAQSSDLIEFDSAGALVRVHPLLGASVDSIAVDAANQLWIGTSTELIKVRAADGAILLRVPTRATSNHCVGLDEFGRPWSLEGLILSRQLRARRPDPMTGAAEVEGLCGPGLGMLPGVTLFQHALVTDPLGDADQDGDANRAEALAGTSPFDPQSNLRLHLAVTGPTRRGTTARLVLAGGPGMAVAFLGRATSVLTVPGMAGVWLLDPRQLTPVVLPSAIPGALPLAIPSSPDLANVELYFQAVRTTPTWTLSNGDSLWIPG